VSRKIFTLRDLVRTDLAVLHEQNENKVGPHPFSVPDIQARQIKSACGCNFIFVFSVSLFFFSTFFVEAQLAVAYPVNEVEEQADNQPDEKTRPIGPAELAHEVAASEQSQDWDQ
jgi:hypothetical protein